MDKSDTELHREVKMEIVDSGTFFGVRPSTDLDLSSETLLATMARNGVSAALTCSLKAIQFDARAGNDQALALCEAHPQLFPVATVDPRLWPDCLAEVERCAGLGFVAFRLAREFQGWAIAQQSLRHLLRAIARSGLPIIVHVPAAGDATALLQVAGGLDLRVILAGVGYSTLAESLAVLADAPNFYLEAHRLTCPGQLETMVSRQDQRTAAGAERLLFASWAPLHAQRPSLDMVRVSELDPASRAAILGGNARRLFGLDEEGK
jgi:predicted TIM-barrel fold metal-dependent hydrolase